MPPATQWPQLKLIFNEGTCHELTSTEFQLKQDSKIRKTIRRSGHSNSFAWTRGVQALTLFLVQYVAWSKKDNPKDFHMRGERDSPAATLDMALGKGKGKDQVNIRWLETLFGSPEKASSSYLHTYIDRTNPDHKRACDPFGLQVLVTQFPPTCVRIFLGERELKEFRELLDFSEKLCKAWKGTQNLPLWPTGEPKETGSCGSFVLPTTDCEGLRNPPAPPPTSKSLADLFKSLSVPSIISHITAALLPARGEVAIEKFSAEILVPECVNILAERVVNESISSFCDFFCARIDPPLETLSLAAKELHPQKINHFRLEGPPTPDIKRCVGIVIASNRDLRERLAAKVARCGFPDMSYWFTAMSFCHERKSERAIVLEVERALDAAAEEPGFKQRFLLYAPERLPELIVKFSNYGCVVAVGIFEKINQEGKREKMRIDGILNGDSGSEKS